MVSAATRNTATRRAVDNLAGLQIRAGQFLVLVVSLLFTWLSPATADAGCTGNAWFKYPQNQGQYAAGSDIYVRVDPQKYQDIRHIQLFVNGQYVRREDHYPYEWAKGAGGSDGHLRNMQPGTYNLKARIKDKCGAWHEIYSTFYVTGGGSGGVGHSCNANAWFQFPQADGTYRYGSDVYVRVTPEERQDIDSIDLFVNGQYVRTENRYPYEWAKGDGNSDGYLRNLARGTYNLKARIKDDCGRYTEIFQKFYVR